jgi:predicted transposase YbfD/YdcC
MPVSSSSLTTIVDDSDPVLGELSEVPAAPAGLLACLAKVTDPRKRRGVRHPITAIVALALAATLAGAQSFVAIGEWVADAEDTDLAALGIAGVVPCESTLRRCLQRLDPGVLDALIGAWMWLRTSHTDGRRIIALDGKSLRGARDAAGHLTHLLSALCQHSATALGQMTVGAKTNEIPILTKLLDTMNITGAVITADALHCQRGTAQYIVSRKAHYILTVKGNQPNLRKQLKALPWKEVPVLSTDREHSHGRAATRTLKATEIAAGIGFPGAVQVLQLTRKTRHHRSDRLHTEVVYALTSLAATDAHANQIAGWLRGHWSRENRLHWVRDVTSDEDRSQNRTAGGPQVMATLRNLAISLLRLNDEPNIASARRHHARDPQRPIALLLNS